MLKRFFSCDRPPRWLVVSTVASLLAGCTSAPLPPPPSVAPAAPTRTTVLLDLGFEKTDDGYVLNLPGPLIFDTGSDTLSDSAKAVLTTLATQLRALNIESLRLFGHTDNVGHYRGGAWSDDERRIVAVANAYPPKPLNGCR